MLPNTRARANRSKYDDIQFCLNPLSNCEYQNNIGFRLSRPLFRTNANSNAVDKELDSV